MVHGFTPGLIFYTLQDIDVSFVFMLGANGPDSFILVLTILLRKFEFSYQIKFKFVFRDSLISRRVDGP